MYYTIISIQYLSILGLFIESWIVFHRWSTRLHAYLFFYCAANLVNNIGYLLELKATTEGEFITALQLSYLGRVFIPYALMLFVAELCKIKIPHIAEIGLAMVHVTTYIMMLSMRHHDLYYKDIEFVVTDGIPQLRHGNGIWYNIYNVVLIIYIVLGMTALVRAVVKAKNRKVKKCFATVIFAMLALSFFLLMSMFKWFEIAKVFDVTSIGYLIGTLFMLIAIFRYELLGTEQLAKDYIVDKLSEGIVAVDEKGDLAYFNKPAGILFPELRVDGGNSEVVIKRLNQAIEKREPIHLNDRVYTPKTDTLLRGNDILGTVYVLQDNTELYKHAKVLEDMTKQANAANAAKSSFLSSMSHEIRTPINAVLGIDEIIIRESRESEIKAYAQDIRTAGKTLLSLINDILDFSKIEEGKLEIIPEQYDVGNMMNDIVNMVQGRADNKGLRLNVNIDRGIPRVLFGDEIRIKQCALNILTNAVKYTEKGSVDLSVEYEKLSGNRILLRFCVWDTGIGIKTEDLEKLFSPFARIEEKRNRSIEGTGLGMSITRQLLALMGSELSVKSEYGVGSEFSFAIVQEIIRDEPVGDCLSDDRSRSLNTVYRELFRAPTAKILVVDDTPINLSVIKGLLKQTLVDVTTAGSGKEALALAEKTKFDIVFIDHMMPEMDGIETLKHLRGLDGYSDTYCVALTANAVSGVQEMYLSEGFSGYLSKPVDGRLLEELLLEHLPKEKLTIPEFDENEEPRDEISELPVSLYDISEIDPKRGVLNCGSMEFYLDTLSVYADSAAENADEIERLWKEGDTANCVIKIHALKSTSRIIGAESLGHLAERLELAGKADELETIASGIDELLTRYRGLSYALGAVFSVHAADNDKETVTYEKLYKAYAEIYELAGNYDDEAIGEIVDDIAKYNVPDDEKEAFAEIKKAYDNFDWGTLRTITSEKVK